MTKVLAIRAPPRPGRIRPDVAARGHREEEGSSSTTSRSSPRPRRQGRAAQDDGPLPPPQAPGHRAKADGGSDRVPDAVVLAQGDDATVDAVGARVRALTGGDMKTYEVADGELHEVTGTEGSVALTDYEGLLARPRTSYRRPPASWSRCRSPSGGPAVRLELGPGWPGGEPGPTHSYIVPLTSPIRWPSGSLNWPRIIPCMISVRPEDACPPSVSALSSAAPTSGTPT